MKYEEGKIVVGTVSGITEYGIFVKFDNYYSGLIHISEVSDKFVSDINSYVKMGDRIKVKILGVNSNNYHLKLSIKNLDYRNVSQLNDKYIVETKSGFKTLGIMLNFWIKEYLKSKKIDKYYWHT